MQNTVIVERPYWIHKIQKLWQQRSIVWLSGVRRTGKTVLCGQVEAARYYNRDLPSTQRQLADPELFLSQQPPHGTIILDEVHRLDEPTLLLKIAADAIRSGGLELRVCGTPDINRCLAR